MARRLRKRVADQEFSKEARKALEKEKGTVEKQIRKCEEEERSSDFEIGDAFNVLAVNRQNHRSLRKKLEDISEALKRLEDGSYGICSDCEQEIPPERLRNAYWVKRDTLCQMKHERTHPREYW